MTKPVNNNAANSDAYRTTETTSNTVTNNQTITNTNENGNRLPVSHYASQNGTFNFEGQMRRFELNQNWTNRAAAINNASVTDNEYVSKTVTFTPQELGVFRKNGKLPKDVKVNEAHFEQKVFNVYGLDQFEPKTDAILKNIFRRENPADAIDWKIGGKPATEFTATLNADGNYEINFQLNKTTDKQLNQALFNRLFFPDQPLDPNLLKVLGNNAAAGNFQQTAESPDLTELALDLTQMGLDVVGIFEPTPFADLTNTGISAVRGNWGDAALSVIGVIPYIGDVAKLGKIPKWLKAIEKISSAIDKFKQIAVYGGKGAEAVKEFVKKAKSVIDSLPIEKLPDSLRDAVKSVKKKIDDFVASMKKTDNPADELVNKSEKLDDVTKVDNPKAPKTDNVTTTKQPDVQPPNNPNIQPPNKPNKPANPQPATTKTVPTDWNANSMGLGDIVEKALKRKDLDADTLKSIDNTLSNLNDALKNGKLENTGAMRDLISNLGKADPKRVSESLAELERASQVLKNADLAPGTKVVIGAREGQSLSRTTGLPDIDVAKVEADVYFKTKDGVLHLNEVKDTFNALTSKIDDGIKAADKGADPKQFERYGDWVEKGNKLGETREVLVVVRKSDPGFDALLDSRRIDELAKTANGDFNKPILQVSGRTLSINDLRQIESDAMNKLGELIAKYPNTKPAQLAKDYFGSLEKTFATLGKTYGKQL